MHLVLIIDDSRSVRFLVRALLENAGYAVIEAQDGNSGLEAIAAKEPDVVLLDIEMPHKNGFEVLSEIDAASRLFSVLLCTTLSSADSIARGLEQGADDYIVKPFREIELLARIHAAVRTSQSKRALLEARNVAEQHAVKLLKMQNQLSYGMLVQQQVKELSEAQAATIFAMAKLAEYRDGDTGAHLEHVRRYCQILAEDLHCNSKYANQITLEFIDCIQHASPLHDIGKVAIADSILQKVGKLTPEEYEKMKAHTVIGADNLQTVYNNYPGNHFIGMGIEIALYHHEKWDGSGYPDGLVGSNIPLSARIMALSDVYDALRSDRCYRKGLPHKQVAEIIVNSDGKHFDPEVVQSFLRIESMFDRMHG